MGAEDHAEDYAVGYVVGHDVGHVDLDYVVAIAEALHIHLVDLVAEDQELGGLYKVVAGVVVHWDHYSQLADLDSAEELAPAEVHYNYFEDVRMVLARGDHPDYLLLLEALHHRVVVAVGIVEAACIRTEDVAVVEEDHSVVEDYSTGGEEEERSCIALLTSRGSVGIVRVAIAARCLEVSWELASYEKQLEQVVVLYET